MNKWIILLIIVTSANSFASGYFDSNQLANYAPSAQTVSTALSTGVNTVGECALSAGESLTPYAQHLASTWSSLPRETQQVILGGAVLATAAYNTPTIYHYLRGTLKSKKDRILSLANNIQLIREYPLSRIQNNFFPRNPGNLYSAILNIFHKADLANSPRGDLLFFKYLKAFTEEEILKTKTLIHHQLAGNSLPASSFMQRWVIGRSEDPYQELSQLISFNKDLTAIIAQLEKEINAELNIY